MPPIGAVRCKETVGARSSVSPDESRSAVRGPHLAKSSMCAYTMIMTTDTKSVERRCVGGCVRKLSRMVTAIYDGALANAGLKTSQFTVLVAVANREKTKPPELINLLQMGESTLSRNVERMRARGWLRLKTGDVPRSHSIEFTDKGKALLRKCLPAWQQAQEEVTRRLGTESVAALRSALRRLPV